VNQLRHALVGILPTGDSLPRETWLRRHRHICLLLWLHVFGVPVFAVLRREPLSHAVIEGAVVGLFAVAASHRRLGKSWRAALATVGLISSSAILVHVSGGLIEMHFHFFVMVVVVSLYQSWVPFLLAVGLVVLHHGFAGAAAPGWPCSTILRR
jgi:hypothetical protein